MKEVVKVSIAGVSFTLDKDAHMMLDRYIEELKEHYKKEASSQEIIEDIEERIMELFIEKGLRERVVAIEDVDSVIKVMGHPKDIDAESGCCSTDKAENGYGSASGSSGNGSDGKGSKKSKKLYRDINNKVLGGVCSGLGNYFKLDTVIVRILFLLIAFIVPFIKKLWIFGIQGYVYGSLNDDVIWGFAVVLYIILWIIVPPAKTVAQRCEMNGESLGVDDIKKRVETGVRTVGKEMQELGHSSLAANIFSVVARIIIVCVGLLLLLTGFSGLVTGMLVFIGIEVFEDITVLGMLEYVELGVNNTLWIKVFSILVWLLPCIGMIYGGIVLCFGLKAPKLRLGLIIFILWIISLLGFITCTAKAFTPYYNIDRESVTTDLPANYDTLYINMKSFEGREECKIIIDKWDGYLKLAYVKKNDNRNTEFINYPTVNINRREVEQGDNFISHIDFRYNTYGGGALIGSVKLADLDKAFKIKDSLITVNYKVWDKENKYNGEFERLNIYIPDRTTVIWVDDNGNEVDFIKEENRCF